MPDDAHPDETEEAILRAGRRTYDPGVRYSTREVIDRIDLKLESIVTQLGTMATKAELEAHQARLERLDDRVKKLERDDATTRASWATGWRLVVAVGGVASLLGQLAYDAHGVVH